MSTNIVCFWWGNWCGEHGPEYVHNLYNNLKRFTTAPFNFYCFTDNPSVLEVPTIEFKPKYKWNLNKLEPWNPKYGFTDRIITIDLDTVILDYVDFLIQDNDRFTSNESFGCKGQCGGGIVSIETGYGRELYYIIKGNKTQVEKETKGAERIFFRKYIENPSFWQRKYSGIYSYKYHCKDKLPNDIKICHFHGRPRPHEISDNSTIKKQWKGEL